MDKAIAKEELEYLVKLGEGKKSKNFEEINGEFYVFENGHLTPIEEIKKRTIELPTVKLMRTTTLTSIVDYLSKNPDKLDRNNIFLSLNYNSVMINSSVFGPEKQREYYLYSEYSRPEFRYSYYYNKEEFLIKLSSLFVENEDLLNVLTIISKTVSIDSQVSEDDGISQSIQIKKGIDLLEKGTLPRLVSLKPFRTFPEIEQPESNFLLRIKKEGEQILISLIEADGGAWKVTAIQRIKDFLEEALLKEDFIIPILS